MIQRVQSLILLAASLILMLLFQKPLAQIELPDNVYLFFHHNRISPLVPTPEIEPVSTWPVSVLLLIIIFTGVFTIFQFRNRVRQIRLCIFNIILLFGLIGLIYFFTRYVKNDFDGIYSAFLWPIAIPFFSIILIYMALKKIQKDELLIKSMDRFRK